MNPKAEAHLRGEPAKIAFVNPSVGFSDRRKSKPIGLAYIMSYLRSRGYASAGFDFGDSEDDAEWLAERYGLDRFEVLGLSVYNESFRSAVEIATWVKRRRPETLIVLGGPHATAAHEHIARSRPCFDVIVRREGEEAMLELLEKRGDPAALRGIAGTTWRVPGGEPLVNPERGFVRDLDELPFPDAEFVSHSGYPPMTYYDEAQGREKAALAICSSRSCPYDCSFCGVLTIGRKYRSHKAERVAEELLYFRERDGVRYEHIYFSDANFFVSPKRALAIARSLFAADPNISFSFGTRVNQILRAADVLPELKRCGLRFIELGIESASPAVLTRLAKGVGPGVNVAAVKLLKRLGIEISLDFIMLDPATTLEDIAANVDFLRENGFYDYLPHDHLYTALVLYEGTPIRRFYEARYGLAINPDELPSPFTLFERPEVQRFCDTLRWFRRAWQGRIDETLARVELAALTAGRSISPEASARLQLDAVALRHAPNLFLENLLADARAGYPLADAWGPEGLLPIVGYDRVPLARLLARAEAAARDLGFESSPLASGTGRLS
jgi:radical SAM superfamily enzyme YgiQ (UPF0313 family)